MFLREIGSIPTSQRCLLDHCFNQVYGVPIAEATNKLQSKASDLQKQATSRKLKQLYPKDGFILNEVDKIVIQQAKIDYLEHTNHIWFLHEERNLLINEKFFDCVFIHENYKEYFESPGQVDIDRDEIFSLVLYFCTQLNITLIKLAANPK